MSDITATNQAYFNQIANEYDSRFASTIAALEAEIKENISVLNIKPNGRLLDYACGTGVLSRALGDNLSQCIGIDVSENMVGAYNVKMANVANRTAYLGDLLSDPPSASLSGAEFHGFDAAGVGAGFHHFDDCVLAATRLVERLVPGGVLFIFDFVPHEKAPDHASSHGVRHHGFSEETIKDVFVKAGAEGDFVYLPMKTEMVFENKFGEGKHMHRQYFMARATKL